MNNLSAPGGPPINCLQVLLQSCSVMASKCISKLAQSRPPTASVRYMIVASKCISKLRSITAFKCISELHDLDLQVHLQTRSIIVSKCISEFNLSLASKCISKLARSLSSNASLSSTWSRPPRVSTNSLNHCLHVCTIMASMYISKLARLQPPSVSLGSLNHGLPVHFHGHSNMASKCIFKFRH